MNSELKYLLIVAGVLAVVYLLNRYSTSESFANNKSNVKTIESQSELQELPQDLSNDNYSSDDGSASHSMKSKFDSKNKSRSGKYKRINYKDGKRGQDVEDISKYFDDHNSLVKDGQLANDDFEGNAEGGDLLAPYRPGAKKPLTDEDIFDSNNFLPKDNNKDWFEVMPEPISVKNRHLINVSRPVGVNTIGNSLRNASYDIRGTPPCPKFVVSPWQQSTIEPDYNIKGLC